MHLTRFEINTARRTARGLLASPQRLHAAVQAAFPPTTTPTITDGRVLWRLDRQRHHVMLYIASPQAPDLTHLVEQVGWPTTHGWDTRDYRPLLDSITTEQEWAFRIKANPVVTRRKNPSTERSQRFGHVTVTQQTEWFLTRTERHGFTIPLDDHRQPDILVRERENLRFDRQGATVTLSTAVFEGRLRITDPKKLRHSLVHGIGPAKGYGCGLLTLAPIHRA